MRSLILAALLSCSAVLAQDLPEYQHLPTFKIDLDLDPSQRFVEVSLALKDQTSKMANDYLHLAPRFLRNFFKENEQAIAARNPEQYDEIVGIANTVGYETYIVLMLNYAFEIGDALCTSIVARTPEGKIIHGRNMDFAFPDAMRNASYVGQFFKGGEHLFDAVMFGGYIGVASAAKANQYSLTLNARGVAKGIEEYYNIMGKILAGRPEIGVMTRNALTTCGDFKCVQDTIASTKTIVPMYVIMAGIEENQGIVMSKDEDGVANLDQLDADHWYLLQTNDDHFAGVCQQRCVDGKAHMDAIGKDGITLDRLLKEVILLSHTFNEFTIYTTMFSPSEGIFNAYGFDTDMPYVRSSVNDLF